MRTERAAVPEHPGDERRVERMRFEIGEHDAACLEIAEMLETSGKPVAPDLSLERARRLDVADPVGLLSVSGLHEIALGHPIFADQVEQHGVLSTRRPSASDDEDPAKPD